MHRAWRRYATVISALFVIHAGALVMPAEIEDGTWEAGAFVAFTTYDNTSTFDDSIIFGGRGAYYFTATHGIQLDVNVGTTDINTRGKDDEFDLTWISLNYIHNFQLKKETRMRPLLIVGFGQLNIDDGVNDTNATTLQVGGGARVSISPHLSFRFDGLLFRWRGDSDGLPVPPDDYFSFQVTTGLSFVFGGSGG